MARYKSVATSPRFLAIDPVRQLVPGTFEHALNRQICPQRLTARPPGSLSQPLDEGLLRGV